MKFDLRLLSIMSVISIVLVAGCIGQGGTQVQAKDCAADENCFNSAAKDCSPAKVSLDIEPFTYENVVTGLSGDNCVISSKITKSDLAEAQSFVGKEMACNVPKSQLADYETYLAQNQLTACSGTLIEEIKKLAA